VPEMPVHAPWCLSPTISVTYVATLSMREETVLYVSSLTSPACCTPNGYASTPARAAEH